MAKFKLRKYPKRPKKTASVAVKERFLQKIKDIDKENARIIAEKKRGESLEKSISNQIAKKVRK